MLSLLFYIGLIYEMDDPSCMYRDSLQGMYRDSLQGLQRVNYYN